MLLPQTNLQSVKLNLEYIKLNLQHINILKDIIVLF
jgi:hypothetical protein